MIITMTLIWYAGFLASHELFTKKKSDISGSGDPNIMKTYDKIKIYLYGSIGGNLIAILFFAWIFWEIEFRFLLFLIYRVSEI